MSVPVHPRAVRWPSNPKPLLEAGTERMERFCVANRVPIPTVYLVAKCNWDFGSVCAFYRPNTDTVLKFSVGEEKMRERGYGPGINVCLDLCARPCGKLPSRNWTWPGSVTDREPYGVVAHELGHHCDWYVSDRKGSYFGDYGVGVRRKSGETPISGYCPNDAEWFAEMFRLFVTNPALLHQLRPRTYGILLARWTPVGSTDWRTELGRNVPDRIVQSLINKGAK